MAAGWDAGLFAWLEIVRRCLNAKQHYVMELSKISEQLPPQISLHWLPLEMQQHLNDGPREGREPEDGRDAEEREGQGGHLSHLLGGRCLPEVRCLR